MTDFYRMIEELFDKSDRKLGELTEEMRALETDFSRLGGSSAATSFHEGRHKTRH